MGGWMMIRLRGNTKQGRDLANVWLFHRGPGRASLSLRARSWSWMRSRAEPGRESARGGTVIPQGAGVWELRGSHVAGVSKGSMGVGGQEGSERGDGVGPWDHCNCFALSKTGSITRFWAQDWHHLTKRFNGVSQLCVETYRLRGAQGRSRGTGAITQARRDGGSLEWVVVVVKWDTVNFCIYFEGEINTIYWWSSLVHSLLCQ